MIRKLIRLTSVAVLAAISGAAIASDGLKLTKEQERKADELGAIDSPAAFLTGCKLMMEPLSPKDQKEYDKSSEGEKQTFNALRAVTTVFCAGMVRAVAETVQSDMAYLTQDGTRICVDQKADMTSVFKKMEAIAISEPKVFHGDGVTTPQFILYTLHKMSACPG